MDAPELSDCIAMALTALKKMIADSNNIAFTLGGDMSLDWANSVQMGWHDAISAVITDIHKLSAFYDRFELVMSDVMHSSNEIERIDQLWNFISTLNNTPLTSSVSFTTFLTTVNATVASYNAILSSDSNNEHDITSKELMDAYPATVVAAVASVGFFRTLLSYLERDIAGLMLLARRYPEGEVESFPLVLSCYRKMGFSIYYSNSHMLALFGDALISDDQILSSVCNAATGPDLVFHTSTN